MNLKQSELKCVLPPEVLVSIYISKHNCRTRFIKRQFEQAAGPTRIIVINFFKKWGFTCEFVLFLNVVLSLGHSSILKSLNSLKKW